jgi:hypothetical protein
MIAIPPRARPLLRAMRVPATLVAVYLVLRFVFGSISANDGLFSPGGSPRLGVMGLGVCVLLLRLVVVFVLPAFVTYRIVVALLDRRPA